MQNEANFEGGPIARCDRPEKRIRRILNSIALPHGVARCGLIAMVALGVPLAYLAAAAYPRSALQLASVPTAITLSPTPFEAFAPTRTLKYAPVAALGHASTPPSARSPRPGGQESRTAQDGAAAGELPRFEVASVKLIDRGREIKVGVQIYPGGRLVISGFDLKTYIMAAFRLSYWQISGGEGRTEADMYEVVAKPAEAMQATIKDLRYTLYGIEDEHLRQMLQALLIDRFQLKFHRETKTGDVYLLERNGKPLALLPTAADSSPHSGLSGEIRHTFKGQWDMANSSMRQLAEFGANHVLGAPVLDRTELSGQFDYRQRSVDIDPNPGGDDSASFSNFIRELGLKLDRTKGPVETFVIDHVARPSPN